MRGTRFWSGDLFVPRGFDWRYVAPHAWLQLVAERQQAACV